MADIKTQVTAGIAKCQGLIDYLESIQKKGTYLGDIKNATDILTPGGGNFPPLVDVGVSFTNIASTIKTKVFPASGPIDADGLIVMSLYLLSLPEDKVKIKKLTSGISVQKVFLSLLKEMGKVGTNNPEGLLRAFWASADDLVVKINKLLQHPDAIVDCRSVLVGMFRNIKAMSYEKLMGSKSSVEPEDLSLLRSYVSANLRNYETFSDVDKEQFRLLSMYMVSKMPSAGKPTFICSYGKGCTNKDCKGYHEIDNLLAKHGIIPSNPSQRATPPNVTPVLPRQPPPTPQPPATQPKPTPVTQPPPPPQPKPAAPQQPKPTIPQPPQQTKSTADSGVQPFRGRFRMDYD